MCALVWNRLSVNHILSEATNGLLSPTYDPAESIAALEKAVGKQSWMMTLTAGINVRPAIVLCNTDNLSDMIDM